MSTNAGIVSVCGQELGQVDWAEPEHEVDEETMSNVKILFVRYGVFLIELLFKQIYVLLPEYIFICINICM